MKYIKKFRIKEAFNIESVSPIMNKIIKYLYKKTGVELFSYGEIMLVNDDGQLLYGHLFFTGTGSAIRFNWIDQGQLKGVKSIEFWDSFEFVNSKTNPILSPLSITMVLFAGGIVILQF